MATQQFEPKETIHFERERGVAEVEVLRGVTHVTVRIPGPDAGRHRLGLLRRFADANIPVFLVKLLPTGVSFALREGQAAEGAALLEASKEEYGLEVALRSELGLVTTRAGAMRDLSGVMAAIYDVLTEEGVAVRQTGDAYNAVHCLVPGADADRAAEALKRRFLGAGEGAA
jgi:aspartokinase